LSEEEDCEGWVEEEGFGEGEGCDYGCGEYCAEPQTKEMGLCTTECQAYLCSVEAEADGGTWGWKCAVCGCTDTTPCPGGCSWVRKNLCSACAEKAEEVARKKEE
jgi:hypothetical protein